MEEVLVPVMYRVLSSFMVPMSGIFPESSLPPSHLGAHKYDL